MAAVMLELLEQPVRPAPELLGLPVTIVVAASRSKVADSLNYCREDAVEMHDLDPVPTPD